MEALRKDFLVVSFKSSFNIGLVDYRYVLICFELDEDFVHCWLQGIWSFQGFVTRVSDMSPLANEIHDQSNSGPIVIDASLIEENPVQTPLIPVVANDLTHNQTN